MISNYVVIISNDHYIIVKMSFDAQFQLSSLKLDKDIFVIITT